MAQEQRININIEEEKGSTSKAQVPGNRFLGVIYTLSSTCAFSLASTLLKRYGSHTHPFNMGIYAFPISTLFFIPFFCVKLWKSDGLSSIWPKSNKIRTFIAVRAILSSFVPYLLSWSLKYISVGDTRTILAASVVTLYVVGFFCLGEDCGVVPICVTILALAGITLITRPPILTGKEDFDEDTLKGVGLAVLALAIVTLIISLLRFLTSVHHSVLNLSLYCYATLQSLILALTFDLVEWVGWENCLGIAVIGFLWGVGNLFLVLALQVEQAGMVGVVRTSEVIFTFVWQWMLIGVAPDALSIWGAALVLSGVFGVLLRKWLLTLPQNSETRNRLAFLLT